MGSQFERIDLGDGKWKFVAPRRLEAFEQLGDSWWKKELVAEGMPPETIYLHCFPFQVSGSPDAAQILKKARAIVRHENRSGEQ